MDKKILILFLLDKVPDELKAIGAKYRDAYLRFNNANAGIAKLQAELEQARTEMVSAQKELAAVAEKIELPADLK